MARPRKGPRHEPPRKPRTKAVDRPSDGGAAASGHPTAKLQSLCHLRPEAKASSSLWPPRSLRACHGWGKASAGQRESAGPAGGNTALTRAGSVGPGPSTRHLVGLESQLESRFGPSRFASGQIRLPVLPRRVRRSGGWRCQTTPEPCWPGVFGIDKSTQRRAPLFAVFRTRACQRECGSGIATRL